jgi:hypothetical protein
MNHANICTARGTVPDDAAEYVALDLPLSETPDFVWECRLLWQGDENFALLVDMLVRDVRALPRTINGLVAQGLHEEGRIELPVPLRMSALFVNRRALVRQQEPPIGMTYPPATQLDCSGNPGISTAEP